MKEDEAKTKWCPFACVPWLNGSGPYGVVAVNRQATGVRPENLGATEEPKCIGSACMAWRWNLELVKLPDTASPALRHSAPRGQSATEGYCGLAGRS